MKKNLKSERKHKLLTFSGTLLFVLLLALISNVAVAQCNTPKESSDTKSNGELIYKCAIKGNLEELKALVEKDKELVNKALENDETALTLAAYLGNVEMVKYLLSAGAAVDTKNKWTNNALLNAAMQGHTKIGYLLLEKGADINVQGSELNTPLLFALRNNFADFAILLIKKGADVNIKNKYGQSPILMASWHGNPDVLMALVEKGADINFVATYGYSVLHNLCSAGNAEAVNFAVQKGADVNLLNPEGQLPIHIAAINKHSGIIQILAPLVKDLNAKEKHFGNTALHIAAMNGDIKSTQYLIEARAKQNVVNNEGLIPVACAAKYGYVTVAEVYNSKNTDYSKFVKQAKMTHNSFSEKTGPDELKVWYTGHSGWALQLKDKVIIIDYWQRGEMPEMANLANGFINTDELKGRKVYVFATHNHRDHYDTTIFAWKDQVKEIKYIYGFKPEKSQDNKKLNYAGPSYIYLDDNQTAMIDDIKLTTIKSDDSGQGFLIEVNGFKIFHPGDHALFNADCEADYKKEIDFIAGKTNDIDIAFLPVTGCPSSWTKDNILKGFFYAIDKLNPGEIYPMHASQREYSLKEFAQAAKEKNYPNKVICVENKGDHSTYTKTVTASK